MLTTQTISANEQRSCTLQTGCSPMGMLESPEEPLNSTCTGHCPLHLNQSLWGGAKQQYCFESSPLICICSKAENHRIRKSALSWCQTHYLCFYACLFPTSCSKNPEGSSVGPETSPVAWHCFRYSKLAGQNFEWTKGSVYIQMKCQQNSHQKALPLNILSIYSPWCSLGPHWERVFIA